jgi:hypothetical protein
MLTEDEYLGIVLGQVAIAVGMICIITAITVSYGSAFSLDHSFR